MPVIVTGTLGGAPVTVWNVTSWPSELPAMLNRTVEPTVIDTNDGLKMLPGVYTSTVVMPGSFGSVGLSCFEQPEIRMRAIAMDSRIRIAALRRIHRVRWLTLSVLTMLWLGACGKDGATGLNGAPATPEGMYSLSTIETKSLPYTMYADTGYTLEITSGLISITSDGKWVSKITSRETVAGFASVYIDSTFGTWTVAASTAAFTNTETQVISNVSWTARDVTVNEVDGAVTRRIVYRKS